MVPVLLIASALCYGAATDYKVTNDGGVRGYYFHSKSEVNVMAYGADPTGVGDSTAAITAAIAAVATGGKIHFPSGTFLVTTLTLTGEKDYIGAGIQNTIIKLKNNTNADLITTNVAFNSYIKIQDMTLDGNRATQASGKVLNLVTTIFTKLERVEVTGGKDYGVYADRCNVLKISDCNLQLSGINFYFKDTGGGGSFSVEATGLQIGDTCEAKIETSGDGSTGTFNACWLENGGAATPSDLLILNGADRIHVSNSIFNSTATTNSAINLKTGSYYNTFIGNTFQNPVGGSTAILIDSGAKHNLSFGNMGGNPITTDNDGENLAIEMSSDAGGYSFLQRGRIIQKWIALADSATPSVKIGNYFVTNGSTSPVTDYTDGQNGQEITICFRHWISVTHDVSKIILNGSANQVFQPGDTLTLFRDASKWKEKGRCVQ